MLILYSKKEKQYFSFLRIEEIGDDVKIYASEEFVFTIIKEVYKKNWINLSEYIQRKIDGF